MQKADNYKDPSMRDFFRMENEKKLTRYRQLNQLAKKGQIVFAGSSLMEQFPVNELIMDTEIQKIIYNRGMSAYTTAQYLDVLDVCVLDLEPSKLFINIGSNDLTLPDRPMEILEKNYREILKRIKDRLPTCQIVILAYYPVRKVLDFPGTRPRTMEDVAAGNAVAAKLAEEFGCTFLNVNHILTDEEGYLRAEYSSDGMHMWPKAYAMILKELEPHL